MAYVDLANARFTFRDELTSVNIREGYGFVASAAQFSMKQSALPDIVFRGTIGKSLENRSFSAVIDEAKHAIALKGILDTFGGQLSVDALFDTDITLAGRSAMALLTDGEPITKTWVNADWSSIVAELVKDAGIPQKSIVPSGIMAGQQLSDGRFLLSADSKTPSEIVNDAVNATGFLASVVEDGSFVFAKEYVPQWYEPLSLKFTFDKDRSDISSLEFNNGAVERITLDTWIEHIPPGAPLQLLVEPSIELAGTYFVTEADYTITSTTAKAVYSVVRELPKLGTA